MSWLSIISLPDFFKHPKNLFEDKADRLSSWIATTFMVACCTISTAGLMVGNHFECMMPANYREDWQHFMHGYCYVQPQYYAEDEGEMTIERQIHYFPWLPYFFFFHALAFCAPLFLWKAVAGRFSYEVESVLLETEEIEKTVGNEKEERIAKLTSHISSSRGSRYGRYASNYFLLSSVTIFFLLKKWLYFVLACIQFYAICFYIGNGDLYWGFKVVSNFINKIGYLSTDFFPLFTFCKVPIAEDNMYNAKVVSCVLGMNVIYEKLYIATYFLLIIVCIISFISAAYYTIIFSTSYRNRLIHSLLKFKNSNVSYKNVANFTHDFLGADGFMTILLIQKIYGDDIAGKILKELWLLANSLSFSRKPNEKNGRSISAQYMPLSVDPEKEL
jgi:hypothetical protein